MTQLMKEGLYEQLLNKLILSKLDELGRNKFLIKETEIDKSEAARVLSQYLVEVIRFALNLISGDDSIEKQIELSNKIIFLLRTELKNEEFEDDLIATEAKILSAIFSATRLATCPDFFLQFFSPSCRRLRRHQICRLSRRQLFSFRRQLRQFKQPCRRRELFCLKAGWW